MVSRALRASGFAATQQAGDGERARATGHIVDGPLREVVRPDRARRGRPRVALRATGRRLETLVPVVVAREHDVDVMLVDDGHEGLVLAGLVGCVADGEERLVGVRGLVVVDELPLAGVVRQYVVEPRGLIGELGGPSREGFGRKRDENRVAVGEVVVVLGAASVGPRRSGQRE